MGLVELARRTAKDPTAIALLVGNVIACVLAARHPPVVMTLLFLYWAECVVIGVLNGVKLWFIRDESIDMPWQGKAPILGFLAIHYLLFVGIAGLILWQLGEWELKVRELRRGFDWVDYFKGFILPVLCLAVAHVWSFFRNFLGQREYEGRTLQQQQFHPYKRVAAMFGITVVSGFLISFARGPELAMLLVVPFKLLADLHAHFRDHRPKPATPQYPQEWRLL